MQTSADEATKAREMLDLGTYTPSIASLILELGGGSDEMHIDYGIEQWEQSAHEIERMAAVASVKSGAGSTFSKKDSFSLDEFKATLEKINDPAIQLLRSFGYETFDYTKDKQVPSARPAPQAAQELAPLLDDILFGRLGTDDPKSAGGAHLSMYG